METKEYEKSICKNCKNESNCKRDCISVLKVNNVIITRCTNFNKNTREVKNFIYKSQIFFY